MSPTPTTSAIPSAIVHTPLFPPLPTVAHGWPCIAFDVPLHFSTWSSRGRGRAPSRHYRTHLLETIATSLPVQEIVARNTWGFFWTSEALLDKIRKLMAAWQFEYSSVAFFWFKTKKSNAAALRLISTFDVEGELYFGLGIVHAVRAIAPHIRIFHPAQGGWREKAEAARFRALGAIAGVVDLVLILPHGHVAWREIKTDEARLSDDQKTLIADLERLGHRWAIVCSVDDTRRELQALVVETREAP
jgi:hypothetical protein